jgi:two-component system phosphate regulon response regulator PhoB
VARLALIDDDSSSLSLLTEALEAEGHEVKTVRSAAAGLTLVTSWRPDLVVLDLILPDLSGSELCRTLKLDEATRTTPLIAVTTLKEEIDRVVAFELGVEDYIVKPFSLRELILRIRAVLRRSAASRDGEGPLQCGRVKLDRLAHRAWVDSESVDLSHLEFKILLTLCEHKNRVQSREALLSSVWGGDATISVRSVDAYVKRLREKLGPARHCIETVRGVGYRLSVPKDAS